MMTSDEIQYVREWAASGNEPREDSSEMVPCLTTCALYPELCELNEAGLTIARLADALEQANKTAETCASEILMKMDVPADDLETMRKNRAELLGDA